LDVGQLAHDLPKTPFRLEGQANGSFQGVLSAAAPDGQRNFTSRLDLQAPRLRVQGIPAERLHGSIAYRKGIVDYRLEGETLGGRFHLDGQLPSAHVEPAENGPHGR